MDAFIEVGLPLSGLDILALALVVRQADYTHEIAMLTVDAAIGKLPVWTTGEPIHITYGSTVEQNLFLGYVDHTRIDATGMTVVVCIGPSYPLKHADQKIYADTTLEDLVQTIADGAGLQADVTPYYKIYDTITQAGESYWAMLVRLAQSVGYSLYMTCTELHFHPRLRDFLLLRGNAPYFGPGTVHSFQPVVGDALVAGDGSLSHAVRQVSTLDQNGDIITIADAQGAFPVAGTWSSRPVFGQFTQRVVDSESEAGELLAGERESNRWIVYADAVLSGDPRVRPAAPVYLAGVDEQHVGYWAVLKAEHRVFPQTTGHTIAARLGRDSQGETRIGEPVGPELATGTAATVSKLNAQGIWVAAASTAVVSGG